MAGKMPENGSRRTAHEFMDLKTRDLKTRDLKTRDLKTMLQPFGLRLRA